MNKINLEGTVDEQVILPVLGWMYEECYFSVTDDAEKEIKPPVANSVVRSMYNVVINAMWEWGPFDERFNYSKVLSSEL